MKSTRLFQRVPVLVICTLMATLPGLVDAEPAAPETICGQVRLPALEREQRYAQLLLLQQAWEPVGAGVTVSVFDVRLRRMQESEALRAYRFDARGALPTNVVPTTPETNRVFAAVVTPSPTAPTALATGDPLEWRVDELVPISSPWADAWLGECVAVP